MITSYVRAAFPRAGGTDLDQRVGHLRFTHRANCAGVPGRTRRLSDFPRSLRDLPHRRIQLSSTPQSRD
jgi:hypothetical protein